MNRKRLFQLVFLGTKFTLKHYDRDMYQLLSMMRILIEETPVLQPKGNRKYFLSKIYLFMTRSPPTHQGEHSQYQAQR